METIKECQLCQLRTSSMSFLLRHLSDVHSNRPGFNFQCGLNGCQRSYHNITTYKHHVYSSHSSDHTNLFQETRNDSDDDSDGDQSDQVQEAGHNDFLEDEVIQGQSVSYLDGS